MVNARIGGVGWWGIGGFVLLLTNACWRLGARALEALGMELLWWQWAVMLGWMGFMAYSEGFSTFQRQVAPRVAARAAELSARVATRRNDGRRMPWRLGLALAAPLVCMGLIYATKRRLIISWIVMAFIVAMVLGVRLLPQPWRGIIDAGVVVGLSWGAIAVVAYAVLQTRGHRPVAAHDMPPASA